MYIQGAIYALYIALLFIYGLFFYVSDDPPFSPKIFIAFPFVLMLFLSFYEIFQAYVGARQYFTSK